MSGTLRQEDFERIFKQHLKIETYSKSIDSLMSPRSLNKINFSPYYQRNYVWDTNKASYFIESILLGTEIPPLIFFNNNTEIEVIDGRQRFETILRFKDNQFALAKNGLTALTEFSKKSYDDLAKVDKSIIENFLDSKIRIIEFALVNEPPLDKFLEDRVKKEIFSRYNTGITPLKKTEIDSAIYDTDSLSNKLKDILLKDKSFLSSIYGTFFVPKEKLLETPPLENILTFLRRSLVLPKIPINYYASSSGRTEILVKFFEYLSDNISDEGELLKKFSQKINYVITAKYIFDKKGFFSNHLVYECLLWGIAICEEEDKGIDFSSMQLIENFGDYVDKNKDKFTDVDYHFYKNVNDRFRSTAEFFESYYDLSLEVYLTGSAQKRQLIKKLRTPSDANSKLSQLDSLRLNKPEPARNSIEDIRRIMQRRRFLVRPSYQRKEVINLPKASSIIESVLLGITLPAIFIFKREDGVSEVVDGQQRLLTLLGFIGSEFIDENGKTAFSKNHKFALRKPRIIREIDALKFNKLTDEQQNKILDFQLYVVEIDETKNPGFDPIDLFIRLNDKPYPIREHSFEMWNSWADFELMQRIKEISTKYRSWFYVKQLKSAKDRDRMENEELFTTLVFLDYSMNKGGARKNLDVYQKTDRINARIGDKLYVSQLLQDATDKEPSKKDFLDSLKNTEGFIKKLKIVLLDADKSKDELFDYLRQELDTLIKGGREKAYFRRTTQDIYLLWQFLNDVNLEMIKFHRLEIKEELRAVIKYTKNIPIADSVDNLGYKNYMKLLSDFKARYKKDERKIRLTEEQKLQMIKDQEGLSGISGARVFLGDEIEVDHTEPLSIGGKDELLNLNISHKDENRKKGSKRKS